MMLKIWQIPCLISRTSGRMVAIEVARADAFAQLPSYIFDSNRWEHAQDLDGRSDGSCHIHVGEPSTGSKMEIL